MLERERTLRPGLARSVAAALVATCCALAVGACSSSPASARTQLATPDELVIAGEHLDLVVTNPTPISPDGAMSANKNGYHDVADQRHLGGHILRALVRHDPTELTAAITAMEYSFAHQLSDGSFQVVQSSSLQLKQHDPVGVAFFYADLGHSLELLASSTWFQTSADVAMLRARVEALRTPIQRGLTWLLAPGQMPSLEGTGQRDTNRWAIVSAALILTGEWANAGGSITAGIGFLRKVLSRQSADGVFPEHGGFDSGYQPVTLENLLYIYLHMPPAQPSLREQLGQAIVRGTARERQAVRPSGEVSLQGNTRVFCGGENFRGRPKGIGGDTIARDFVYASAIDGDATLVKTASQVIDYYRSHTTKPCAGGASPSP